MPATPPKVLLHGAGAVGTIYVYQLITAGCDVTAVCRSNYEAAKADGFHLDSQLYGRGIHIRPHIVKTPAEAAASGPYDYVLVTAKALPEAKISETIAPAVTPGHTTIVLIQNGISIEEEYATRFPTNPILSCVVYLPATQIKPGHIEMGDIEWLEVGPFPAAQSTHAACQTAGETLIEFLKAGGGNPRWHDDIQEKRWYKLLLNASWNPICALTVCRDVAFLDSSEVSKELVRDVMNEVRSIAKALGYHSITDEMVTAQLTRAVDRGGTKGIEPSMLVDVLWSRRMEVEVILGNPVRVAKMIGVSVPRLELLYGLMKALDRSVAHRKPGESLDGTCKEP